jgi:hypothetical protein
LDVVLAPCGVEHGGKIPSDAKGAAFPGGFASPPQLDLYMRTPYYKGRQVSDAGLRDARDKIT